MDDAFAAEEQTALVERFIASVPGNVVGPVLAKGPTEGEQGPLRTLIASWLDVRPGRGNLGEGTKDPGNERDDPIFDNPNQPPAKRSRSGADAGTSTQAVGPIDHIFQFHAALRR